MSDCKACELVSAGLARPAKCYNCLEAQVAELRDENKDLRAACEQKQEIINGSETIRKEQDKELQALREALTPSVETKARYWGGDDLPMMNWGDIKLLMQTIRERAGVELLEGE